MTLFLIFMTLLLAAFWREALGILLSGAVILLLIGMIKVAEVLHLAGVQS